jgi:hypothetical protein
MTKSRQKHLWDAYSLLRVEESDLKDYRPIKYTADGDARALKRLCGTNGDLTEMDVVLALMEAQMEEARKFITDITNAAEHARYVRW